jgi:hypothetical protein
VGLACDKFQKLTLGMSMKFKDHLRTVIVFAGPEFQWCVLCAVGQMSGCFYYTYTCSYYSYVTPFVAGRCIAESMSLESDGRSVIVKNMDVRFVLSLCCGIELLRAHGRMQFMLS